MKYRILFIAVLTMFVNGASLWASDEVKVPDASVLQNGDLIWSKRPNDWIPYGALTGEAGQSEATRWGKQKREYLASLEGKTETTTEERATYLALSQMTYKEFTALYFNDQSVGKLSHFANGSIYVGHIGMISIVNGQPLVLQAIPDHGVEQVPYDKWIADRKGDMFWVARLTDVSPEVLSNIVHSATSNLGKPYSFWNFDLSDCNDFYCSKLVWSAIFTGAGIAIDDDPNPKRSLWISPKQIMGSKHLHFILSPTNATY